MGTDKRERQKANRAAKLEAEQAAQQRAKRRQAVRNALVGALVVVVALALVSVLSGCGSDDSDDSATTEATGGTGSDGEAGGEEACESAPDGVRQIDFDEPPSAGVTAGDEVTATFETTKGTVVVALDTERTPKTTDNFVALALHCYYDGTDLFRTEAASGIIQGGGPHTQDNTDPGPGYTIADEGLPFAAEDYAPGTIAMANTGQPDSASAQFFFLANEGGRYLGDPAALGPSAGSYAVFGQVTEGLEVLEAIAALDDGSGKPSEQVTIDRVTIDGA